MGEPRNLEHQPPLATMPEVVLDALDRQPAPDNFPVVHQDDVGVIRRVYTQTEQLARVGAVTLSVDQRHYYQTWPDDHDMVDFQYNQDVTPVATMQFLLMPDGSYGLHHRYVSPDFRGKGVGDRLLAQAEAAFQQLANRGQAVEIRLQGGQRGVIQWFLDHGYSLKADGHSESDWESIRQEPEKYKFETITDPKDGVVKEDCIFRVDTEGRTLDDTVRINLQKILQPAQ